MSNLYVTFKCHPTSAGPINFRIIPHNCTEIFSAEFCGISEKNWNDISVHFHWISAHFNRTVKFYGNVRKSEGKASLYGDVRNCTEIGEKNSVLPEMCGNQIWLRSGFNWLFNLILTAVKMQKKTIVKSC